MKMKQQNFPLDPNAELFRWGPAPIRIFFTADFLEGIFNRNYFQKAFKGEKWPKGLALYRDKRMVFVNEWRDMHRYGGSVFLKYMLPTKKRRGLYRNYIQHLKKLHRAEQKIERLHLPQLTQTEFARLWHSFHVLTINFWIYVTVPELGNYGSLPILEEELKAFTSNDKERQHMMEVLTAPEKPSFYQEEEIDLAETNDILGHQKKYFWLKNSYDGVEIVDVDYFSRKKREQGASPRAEFEEKRAHTKERKIALTEKYKLPQRITAMAAAIVAGIEWQDARKREVWIYLHYKNLMLNEVCRRYKYKKDDLLNLRELEIERIINKKQDVTSLLDRRRRAFGFLCADGAVTEIMLDQAENYWSLYSEEKAGQNITELRGVVASRGSVSKLTGFVQVILDPKDADHFRENSILVAPMTTPEYVFIMKRSMAVITDTGGLTSHAAIVSRELRKPCIVGTKIATKVLRDGDLVEVDANEGVVKIIKEMYNKN